MNNFTKILFLMALGLVTNLNAGVFGGAIQPRTLPSQAAPALPKAPEARVSCETKCAMPSSQILAEDIIKALEGKQVDENVMKMVRKILHEQKTEKLDTIITNQRIMMVLLAAIATKLVVYDLIIEKMQKVK